MRRARKMMIVLMVISCVLSLVIGLRNIKVVQGESTLKLSGYGEISAVNGGVVEYGTYEQPNLAEARYTGVKLTGKSGAKFNLGEIDISKSKWDGRADELSGSNSESFIEYVYQPTKAENINETVNGGTNYAELQSVTIKLEQGEKNIEIEVSNYYQKNCYDIVIKAKADNQSNYGCYRSGNGFICGTVRKNKIQEGDAEKIGLEKREYQVNSHGASESTIPLYYNANEKAIYTSITGDHNDTLKTSYLIRDFDSSSGKENDADDVDKNGNIKVWSGFKAEESGEIKVKCSVTFGNVNDFDESDGEEITRSSIIITKIGEYVCDKGIEDEYENDYDEEPDDESVIIEEKSIKCEITNGKYDVIRNGERLGEITTVEAGDKIEIQGIRQGEIELNDIREISVNGKEYESESEMPITKIDSGSETRYIYTIGEESKTEIKVRLDKKCRIRITDEYNTVAIESEVWYSDEEYKFPKETSNASGINYGYSNGEKVLIGYVRTDEIEQGIIDSERTIKRSGEIELETEMAYKTVYLKVRTRTEFKLVSRAEEHTGLRYIVSFDKSEIEEINGYLGKEKSSNPFKEMHSYITTVGTLKDANKVDGYSVKEISANSWYNGNKTASGEIIGWSSGEYENSLKLINGTGKSVSEMTGKHGYVYDYIGSDEEIWLDERYNADENSYAYAYTIRNISSGVKNNEYVFMTCVNFEYESGAKPIMIFEAIATELKSEAESKLNKIIHSDKEENAVYTYKVTGSDGITYYSNYTVHDLNWLASITDLSLRFS